MKYQAKSHLILLCLATPAALALGGCAAGPLGALSATLVSLLLGLGLSGCYSHASDTLSGLREEDGGGVTVTPPSDDDHDGDGYTAEEGDCDDVNPNAHPGAYDDNPCDGVNLDCVAVACNPFFPADSDNDNDGYDTSTDCNDYNENIHPGALDNPCDSVDSDCSGGPEYSCNPMPDFYDDDGDGWSNSVDCNDANPLVHPGANDPDECDGVDENCNSSEFACNTFVIDEDAGTDDPNTP